MSTRPFLALGSFTEANIPSLIGGGSVFAMNTLTGVPRFPIQGCGQTRIASDCQRRY